MLLTDVSSRRGGAKSAGVAFLIQSAPTSPSAAAASASTPAAAPLLPYPHRVVLEAKVYSRKGFFNKYARYSRGRYGATMLSRDVAYVIVEANRAKDLIMMNLTKQADQRNPRHALSVDVPYVTTQATNTAHQHTHQQQHETGCWHVDSVCMLTHATL